MRILVVEDDSILADGLRVGLGMEGFTADVVSCLEDARAALAGAEYRALVLDLMLPDGSGLELLRELRAGRAGLPVLLLTARDQVEDRVAGLDAGADDYLGKPFDLDELAARLRALSRRSDGRAAAQISHAGLELDPGTRSAAFNGQPLKLSRREFAVLQALAERPGRVLAKSDLEDRLYGWDEEVESNAVEVHIHHLRAKLGRDFIETLRGIGYRLRPEETSPSRSASASS
ncbi:response regulator transcription factor [Thioclava sp. F28-4]|uniref:response regulator n=1 Tax=Thioclava sp. F28-4 TaxID=1915315 RepID=UPI0009967FED|nr:response regulator transcription factor [Thioclava sp. F28-4]OOY06644.1 DNA-binding response regulator [Thioclava sp. F28-4]